MSELDSKDFDRKFKKVVEETIPDRIEKGLALAAMQLLNDAVLQAPTVPYKEGWLRGSGSVFVNNRLIAESPHGKQKFANKDYYESLKKSEFVAVVGFNTPYARRLHESSGFKFREPSSGAKYLERKLVQNKDVYQLIIAKEIKRG